MCKHNEIFHPPFSALLIACVDIIPHPPQSLNPVCTAFFYIS